MRDSGEDYTIDRKHTVGFKDSESLELLQSKISTQRATYVPGGHHRSLRFAGWKYVDDDVCNWNHTDNDGWKEHRGLLVVGGKVSAVSEMEGVLQVTVEAATEGTERDYHAVVVESAATYMKWIEPEGADGDTYFAGEREGRRRRQPYSKQDYDNAYSAMNEMAQGGCGPEDEEEEEDEG